MEEIAEGINESENCAAPNPFDIMTGRTKMAMKKSSDVTKDVPKIKVVHTQRFSVNLSKDSNSSDKDVCEHLETVKVEKADEMCIPNQEVLNFCQDKNDQSEANYTSIVVKNEPTVANADGEIEEAYIVDEEVLLKYLIGEEKGQSRPEDHVEAKCTVKPHVKKLQKVRSCAAFNCQNNRRMADMTLFGFPADLARRTKWIEACRRFDIQHKSYKSMALCRDHFEDKFFRSTDKVMLTLTAVPSIFNFDQTDAKKVILSPKVPISSEETVQGNDTERIDCLEGNGHGSGIEDNQYFGTDLFTENDPQSHGLCPSKPTRKDVVEKKIRIRYCAAYYCQNNNWMEGMSLFTFPADPERREKWIKASRRYDIRHKNYRAVSLCPDHFEDRYLLAGKAKVTRNSIPTIFNFDQTAEMSMPPKFGKVSKVSASTCVKLANKILNEEKECQMIAVPSPESNSNSTKRTASGTGSKFALNKEGHVGELASTDLDNGRLGSNRLSELSRKEPTVEETCVFRRNQDQGFTEPNSIAPKAISAQSRPVWKVVFQVEKDKAIPKGNPVKVTKNTRTSQHPAIAKQPKSNNGQVTKKTLTRKKCTRNKTLERTPRAKCGSNARDDATVSSETGGNGEHNLDGDNMTEETDDRPKESDFLDPPEERSESSNCYEPEDISEDGNAESADDILDKLRAKLKAEKEEVKRLKENLKRKKGLQPKSKQKRTKTT